MSKNNLKNTVLDVLIVGAGFAGMYMLYKFREQGLNQASYLNSNIERDRVISRGPAESGGRRNDLLSVTSLERALMEIAAQLKGQYILKYSRPPTLIPPNQVEIDIRQKGADASLDITLTRLSATK